MLHLLLVLLIAVGPWPVLADHSGDEDCCPAEVQGMEVMTGDCCGHHPQQGQDTSCHEQDCSSTHCSSLSFLPSPDSPRAHPETDADILFVPGDYGSHHASPDTPPPILRA